LIRGARRGIFHAESRSVRIPRLKIIVFAWMVAARLFPDGPPPRPGREVSFLPEEIKDTFFAYVLGVVRSGVALEIDNADMREILTEFKASLELPFDKVDRVVQSRGVALSDGFLSIAFSEDIRIPIPFSFLGYHPGAILASQTIGFSVDRTVVPNALDSRFADPLFLLRLSEGYLTIKVDDWLKFLFPTIVDDLHVDFIAAFRFHGDWFCLLSGWGSRGTPIQEIFNMTRNRIIYPHPADLRRLTDAIVDGRPLQTAAGMPADN
jgi:hypothetical protein